MKIFPVLDIRGGQVVRAVAGRRDEYRPLESNLTDETTAAGVADALRRRLGLREFYVADLDAILEDRPGWSDIQSLVDLGLSLMCDLGVRHVERAREAVSLGVARVVVGLESSPSPRALNEIVAAIGPERTVFSLDLMNGRPMSAGSAWPETPIEIACSARDAGATSMVVLDLAAVGETRGLLTRDLCLTIRNDPMLRDVEILTGGGIRHETDIDALGRIPVEGVLISSALHGPDRNALNLSKYGCSELG